MKHTSFPRQILPHHTYNDVSRHYKIFRSLLSEPMEIDPSNPFRGNFRQLLKYLKSKSVRVDESLENKSSYYITTKYKQMTVMLRMNILYYPEYDEGANLIERHPKAIVFNTVPISNTKDDPKCKYFVNTVELYDDMTGYIFSLCKLPSHGLSSGNEALEYMLAFFKSCGTSKVKLGDTSSVKCGNHEISLKNYRVLTRGSTWYASKGFRPATKHHNNTVLKFLLTEARAVKVRDIINYFLNEIKTNEKFLKFVEEDGDCEASFDLMLVEPYYAPPIYNEEFRKSIKRSNGELTNHLSVLKGLDVDATVGDVIYKAPADCDRLAALLFIIFPGDSVFGSYSNRLVVDCKGTKRPKPPHFVKVFRAIEGITEAYGQMELLF